MKPKAARPGFVIQSSHALVAIACNGIVYQKDLGPETLTAFKSMERYNPDKTWKATDDQWQE